MKILRFLILLWGYSLWPQTDKITDSILEESTSLIYTNIEKAEKQALFLVQNQNRDKNSVQAFLVLADAAYLKGDFLATITNLSHAEKSNTPSHSLHSEILIELYIAQYYRLFGFRELSIQHKNQALKKLKELPQKDVLSSQLWARYYLEEYESMATKQGRFASLLKAAEKLDNSKQSSKSILQYQIEIALASHYTKVNDFDSTKNYVLPIINEGKQNVITARALLALALMQKKAGKPYLENLFKANNLLEIYTDIPTQRLVCKELSENLLIANKITEYKSTLKNT